MQRTLPQPLHLHLRSLQGQSGACDEGRKYCYSCRNVDLLALGDCNLPCAILDLSRYGITVTSKEFPHCAQSTIPTSMDLNMRLHPLAHTSQPSPLCHAPVEEYDSPSVQSMSDASPCRLI